MRPDLGYTGASARQALQPSRTSITDTNRLLTWLPALMRSAVQLATFRAGDQRLTEHKHVFLPKDFKGDPNSTTFKPWTETEIVEHLAAGWGLGAIRNLEASYLLPADS